eukprot:1501180-Prymnesium_polylepis.1
MARPAGTMSSPHLICSPQTLARGVAVVARDRFGRVSVRWGADPPSRPPSGADLRRRVAPQSVR